MRNIIHWLNAFTLGLGVAALATLAASAKQASKYFVAYAILCYSIGALAGGYEDGTASVGYPFRLVTISQLGGGEHTTKNDF